MFRGYRSFLSALGFAGVALLAFAPAASAASVTPPGIYTQLNGPVLVYDGSGAAAELAPLPNGNIGGFVWDAAVSPDGRTLYTVFAPNAPFATELVVQDLPSGTVRSVVVVASGSPVSPKRIALSPDGSTAYVAADGSIYPVTVATGDVGSPFSAANVVGLAVSLNGNRLYVSSGNHLLALDANTGAVVHDLDLGQPAGAIKISADGQTIYVIGDADGTSKAHVFKIRRASFAIADQAVLPGSLDVSGNALRLGFALSPDQSLLYVTGSDQSQGRVFAVPVRTSSLAVGTAVQLDPSLNWGHLNDAAFTPDGRFLYTYADGVQGNGEFVLIDVATNTVIAHDRGLAPRTSVLTTPEQAPVAALSATARCAGTATSFDASSSTTPSGTIVRFAWDFGDRTTKDTTGPTVKHVYAKPGSYAASVTETNSAGVSTTVVFDGQTVIRNGSPSARATHTVTVAACAVPPVTPGAIPGQSSSVADSLPVTGSDTPAALLTSGLLLVAGLGLRRAARRRTHPVR